MTVSSSLNRKAYTGDGVTTSFSTSPVVFYDTDELDVYVVTTATGASTTLTENTHYTVSGGAGSTGSVSLAGGSSPYGAPSASQTLVIVRTLDLVQEFDPENNDGSDAENIETAFDKLTMMVQQNAGSIARALRQPDSDTASIGALPSSALRANKYLAFDSSGDPIEVAAGTASGNSVTASGSTTARLLADRAADERWVSDFGAVGDGVADDTAAIQAAIDACEADGGGLVRLSPGTYRITASLTIDNDDVALCGAGVIDTILAPSTGAITAISVGQASAVTYGAHIRDLRIEYGSGTTVTAGAGILLLHTYYPIVENVYINNPYVGIAVSPSVGVRIVNCHLIGFNAKGGLYGIDLYGDSNAISGFVTIPTQVFVEGVKIFGPQIDGFSSSVRIRAGEQVSFRDCYVAQGDAYNFLILQDSNNWSIYDLFINDTYIDAATTAGIVISGATGNGSNNIQNIHIANTVVKGQSGDGTTGISVDGTSRGSTYPQALNGLKITNCTIAGWSGNGITLGGGYGATITGAEIKGNNYLNSLSASGIVVGAAAQSTTIVGNRIGGDAFSANSANAFQVYGVRVDAGATRVSIIGNNVTGNVTAGVIDNSGTTNNVILNNIGHVPTPIGVLPNIPIGAVAYGSLGTSAVHVAGTIYVAEINVPMTRTVTGVGVLNGGTVGTDNLIVALYKTDGGAAVATSALTGTLSAGTNAFQNIPFTAAITIPPGRYWIGVQCNGTTATTRRIAANTYLNYTKATAGVFGTISSLTVPASTTADAGPIAYLY